MIARKLRMWTWSIKFWISFFDDYVSRARQAYPVRSDGKTLFPFRRLFIVAKR